MKIIQYSNKEEYTISYDGKEFDNIIAYHGLAALLAYANKFKNQDFDTVTITFSKKEILPEVGLRNDHESY